MAKSLPPVSTPLHRKILPCILLLTLLLGCWVWNLHHSIRVAADDAFVYMRYAQHFVEQGQLEWNLGELGTDGFTSFLHQGLLILLFFIVRADPVTTAWALSIGTSSLCILLLSFLHFRRTASSSRDDKRALWSGGLAICLAAALSPLFSYWAHSMMDVGTLALTLVCASFSFATLMSSRAKGAVLGALGMLSLALARPEGLLVCIVLTMLLTLHACLGLSAPGLREQRRIVLLSTALLSLMIVLFSAWHLKRYGSFFPNPVYVKTAGLSNRALSDGLSYLLEGPGAGYTPTGLRYQVPGGQAAELTREQVQEALTPGDFVWPYYLVFLGGAALLCLTFIPSLWSSTAHRHWLRYLLLPSLGLLSLAVLAGGDPQFMGWRLLTGPCLLLTYGIGLSWSWLRGKFLQSCAAVILLALVFSLGQSASQRSNFCSAHAAACGWQAPTLQSYAWDSSDGAIDTIVASALRKALPTSLSIAQSDYLRLGVHLPEFKILDLSGLLNADLAHRPHTAKTNLFDPLLVVEFQPSVVFWGWNFISERKLADMPICDSRVRDILSLWPEALTEPPLQQICSLYRSASIALPNQQYFNFLIHRDALPQLRTAHDIMIFTE
ncbi:MAG: hypothetical protein J0M12_00770 [Deltaproteobacteria bacterium]|nr:hypothetical protein [Deltaproteobacteria bacterium]